MMENILPIINSWKKFKIFSKLKEQQKLNLSLDFWMNNSGNSIYTLMALKGEKRKYLLNFINLNYKCHTEEKTSHQSRALILEKNTREGHCHQLSIEHNKTLGEEFCTIILILLIYCSEFSCPCYPENYYLRNLPNSLI